MKKKYLLFIFSLCLLVCGLVWAQKKTAVPAAPAIEIKVTGLQDSLLQKVTDMLINRSKNVAIPLTQSNVQRFYRKSPEYIRGAMQPYGYFDPQIRSHIERRGINWVLFFNITAGPAIKIIHIDVVVNGDGKNDRAFQNLLKKLPIHVGDVLNIDEYQAAKDALFNLAANRGYFDAKMTLNQIIINTPHRQASIVLHFDTGQRYRFGPTLFPPSDLNLDLLERFLRYQTGEYYNSNLLQKTQQALAGSGYFYQSVVTPATTESTGKQVPIKVELTPVKPRRYTFGAGYGTDTGPRGTFGFNWIPINSYGHHINFLARGSYINTGGRTTQNNSVNMSYFIPGRDPATDSYAFTTGYGMINQDTGSATSFKTALSYNTVLGDDWRQTLALTYLIERYQLTDLPFINANLLYPNGHWQYIRNRVLQKDKVIANGISATIDLAGASQAVLSQSSFLQGKVGFKGLTTLDVTQTRFLFRTTVAHTQIQSLDTLPLTLQLFAGGPTSLRGFAYNSIGPGADLVLATTEIQQRVYGNWYAAVFMDSMFMEGALTSSDNGYKAGAGVGGVLLTPIGAVELAVARPVINGDFHKTWQIEFSVGAEL